MLARHASDHAPSRPVVAEAAFLLMDVVGFSRVAAELSSQGARGAEELSRAVIPLFAAVTGAVVRMGGDVLYFAGDAVGVAFLRAPGEPAEEPVLRASQAALDALATAEASATEGTARIRVRAAIGWGRCTVLEAGGYQGQWQLFVHGEGVEDLGRADKAAAVGTLTITARAYAVARGRLEAAPLPGDVFRVTGLRARVAPWEGPSREVPPEVEAALMAVIPPTVRQRIESGGRNPIAEFRAVTAVFVRVHDLDLDDPAAPVQETVRAVQQALVEAGGVVHAIIGDKGFGLLGLFGVPPLAHEDDAARAIDASVALHQHLQPLGPKASVGIASGRVFCTEHGAGDRRGFDVVGATLVLAARLMQSAGRGVTLCCEETRRLAARYGHGFGPKAELSLKGFAQPMPGFVARGRTAARSPQRGALLGRDDELGRAEAWLDQLAQGVAVSPVWIEGEAGIGKSTLVQAIVEAAAARSIQTLTGGTDALETQTPYYSLRGVIRGLAGVHPGLAADEARTRVVAWVAQAAPEHVWLTGLLEAVVPLGLQETEEARGLDSAARAERLAELVVALLAAESAVRPVVLVLEDLHWLGSETWNILRAVAHRCPRVWLVGTFRPLDHEPPFLSASGARMHLGGLARAGTASLVARCLGVQAVPDALVDLVHARSEGNPLFTEEIVSSLREGGTVRVHDGQVSTDLQAPSAPLPTTIAGVVTARLDRLALQVRTLVKIAAVIGRSFAREILEAIVPDELVPALDGSLDTLVTQRFIALEPGCRDVWAFRHALIHEASYALLPFAQRRPLHQAAATQLARRYGRDPAYAARLAHHFTEADDPAEAAVYCGLAGRFALDAYAHEATIDFLSRALDFDLRARGERAVDTQRAVWCRQIAEAYVSQLRHREALHWYGRAWTLAGWSPPRGSLGTLAEVGRNLWARLRPPTPTHDPALLARCEQVLASSSDICSTLIFDGQTLSYLHTACAADNVGRLVERGRYVAEARAAMGYLLVAMRLQGPGLRDLDVACEIAERALDGHTACPFTIRGMALVVCGRVEESLPSHRRAIEISERFSEGLWRHRTLFMCAEATLMLGRYEETIALMTRVVPIALLAEPSSAGQATAIMGLCRLRMGTAPGEVVAALDGPVGVVTTQGDHALQEFSAKAILAWALWLDGQGSRALDLAREALDLAARSGLKCFSYLRAIDGHLHLVLLCLQALAAAAPRDRNGLASLLARALAHVAKQATMHPVLASHRDLCAGLDAERRGHLAKARACFVRAAAAAQAMGLPWEEASASLGVARLSTGPARRAARARTEALAAQTHDRQLARATSLLADGSTHP